MKLAIMQPYFFPYLGYFQLAASVDKFVFLDDVNFIKKGWINRNRILVNGEPAYFTAPVQGASQNKKINELLFADNFAEWSGKFLKTIEQSYKKSSGYADFYPKLETFLSASSSNLAEFAKSSVKMVADLLELETELVNSSSIYENSSLKGEDRILDICKRETCTNYRNLPGGREIYNGRRFADEDIQLEFLEPLLPAYSQPSDTFAPGLSILDVLMNCGISGAKTMVSSARLTP